MGPSLAKLAEDYPEDKALKHFIRQGKGMMPESTKFSGQRHRT